MEKMAKTGKKTEKIGNINREITKQSQDKIDSITINANKKDAKNTIYTVEYTAYLNENILSLIIEKNFLESLIKTKTLFG